MTPVEGAMTLVKEKKTPDEREMTYHKKKMTHDEAEMTYDKICAKSNNTYDF